MGYFQTAVLERQNGGVAFGSENRRKHARQFIPIKVFIR